MENSHRRDICIIDVHRASFVKHPRSKNPLENEKQNGMIIPERLLKESKHLLKTKLKNI